MGVIVDRVLLVFCGSLSYCSGFMNDLPCLKESSRCAYRRSQDMSGLCVFR